MANIEARRVEYMGRRSVLLANGEVRALFDATGSMIPEFGVRRGPASLNAHWLPDFRDVSGLPFSPEQHGAYWKAKLLYLIAGDFVCSPSFGPPCTVDGVALPPHGFTANEEWGIDEVHADPNAGVARARFSLQSPAAGLPLSWERCDLVLEGQPAYFSSMTIRTAGRQPSPSTWRATTRWARLSSRPAAGSASPPGATRPLLTGPSSTTPDASSRAPSSPTWGPRRCATVERWTCASCPG